MERQRVLSVIEDPSWGRGIVFSTDPDSKVQLGSSVSVEVSTSKLETTISTIKEENEQVQDETDQDQPDQAETEVDRYHLQYLHSSFFATVLEDSLTELRILAQVNNELKISQTMSDIVLLRALKFNIQQPESHDELDTWDLNNLGCLYNKIKKLDFDRKYINNILVSTYLDLTLSGRFKVLKDHIDSVNDLEKYRVVLEQDEVKHRLLRKEMYRQVRQQTNHIKSAIYDCECTIEELKKNVEDSSLNSAVRSRYVENWQIARTEQNTQTIHDKEFVRSDSIEYLKMRNDHEHRVHSEVELLGNIIINETLDKVERWMNKYDKDMEQIDLKIQIKKNEYQNMRDQRIKYETKLEKHDQMMKNWIHFKEEREKARRYHDLMMKSAIIVQAWWRGLLVRRQLGPYKVVKKKKEKKK